MKCITCGFENRDGILFCEECGTRFETMNCSDCGFQNRPGVNFCEECGHLFAAPEMAAATTCPDCGFENRPGVNFCEDCGHLFAAPEMAAATTCPDCGFKNRPDVNFCEDCGHAFTAVETIGTRACPDCGFENRPGVNFCEDCGYSFIVADVPVIPREPLVRRPVRDKPRREPSRKRAPWIWAGGAVGALVLAAMLIWSVPRLTNPPIEDFTPIMAEIEDGMVSTARDVAKQVSPWADPDTAELQQIDSENGKAFMITFEGEKSEEGFNPRMMVLIDPVTGESTYFEAP